MLLISSVGIHFYINRERITSDAHLTSGVGCSWRFTVVHSLSKVNLYNRLHKCHTAISLTYLTITTNEQQNIILMYVTPAASQFSSSLFASLFALGRATSLFHSLRWFSDSEAFIMKSCLVIV